MTKRIIHVPRENSRWANGHYPQGPGPAPAARLCRGPGPPAERGLGRGLCRGPQRNQHSLRLGMRLLSAYTASNGVKFWIITEADRSVTTVLLPRTIDPYRAGLATARPTINIKEGISMKIYTVRVEEVWRIAHTLNVEADNRDEAAIYATQVFRDAELSWVLEDEDLAPRSRPS